MRRAFVLSLVLHVAAVLVSRRGGPTPEPKPVPVELWAATPRAGGKGREKGKLGLGKGKVAGASELSLGKLLDLGPGPAGGGGGAGAGKGAAAGSDLDTLSAARGLRYEDEVAMQPWVEEVWRRLDAAVDYPEDFIRRRVAGTVRLQVQLNGKGTLQGGFHRVSSTQKFLKAYTLGCLSKGLREALPERLWRKEGMALALHFHFGTSADPGNADRDRGGIIRNQLTFYRLAYAKPLWEENFERFFTKYVPPILPIPGGFIVDFVRLYHMIDEWGKEDQADVEAARIEQMYQLLKARPP